MHRRVQGKPVGGHREGPGLDVRPNRPTALTRRPPPRHDVVRCAAGLLLLPIVVVGTALVPAGVANAAAPAPLSTCNSSSPNTVTSGQELATGGCLLSPDRDYELIMQTDGNLVLYYESQSDPLWNSDTEGNPGAYAIMQTDGNLVVYPGGGGSALWNSASNGAPNATLVMQTDGNAVVYGNSLGQQSDATSAAPYAAWNTGTENLRGYEMTGGSLLEPGQYLESQNGAYGLTMGTGGALVLYQTSQGTGSYQCPMWAEPSPSGTNPLTYAYDSANPVTNTAAGSPSNVSLTPNAFLAQQTDGNLVLYPTQTNPSALWAAGTVGNPGAYTQLQTDGNLVVYSAAGTALWESGTPTNGGNRGWALCTGEELQIGQRITNWTSGGYLTMQSDCNLVLYNSSGTALWSTNTDINNAGLFDDEGDYSTLYGLQTSNPQASGYYVPGLYNNCYAEMEPNGNIDLFAPNVSSLGYTKDAWFDGVAANEFWSSLTWHVGPVMQVLPKSFGPFLAYVGADVPNSDTSPGIGIDNAAGFQVGTNPVNVGAGIYTTQYIKSGGTQGEAQDLTQEIEGFLLMVLVPFL
jgi:hypothetical protein